MQLIAILSRIGVVIKDFKSHAPASAYKNKKLKEHPDWSVEIQEKAR